MQPARRGLGKRHNCVPFFTYNYSVFCIVIGIRMMNKHLKLEEAIMWFNIFMTVFGLFVLFILASYFGSCLYNYRDSRGFEKKAWKRALEGWGMFLLFFLLDFVVRTVKLFTN
jgi:hypothetical protein